MYHPFGKELLDWLAMGAVHMTLMSIFVFASFYVDIEGKIWELSI